MLASGSQFQCWGKELEQKGGFWAQFKIECIEWPWPWLTPENTMKFAEMRKNVTFVSVLTMFSVNCFLIFLILERKSHYQFQRNVWSNSKGRCRRIWQLITGWELTVPMPTALFLTDVECPRPHLTGWRVFYLIVDNSYNTHPVVWHPRVWQKLKFVILSMHVSKNKQEHYNFTTGELRWLHSFNHL